MYAVEFETIVDSPYIKLENHKNFLNQKIKVIILADEKKSMKQTKDSSFFDKLRSRDLHIDPTIDINNIIM